MTDGSEASHDSRSGRRRRSSRRSSSRENRLESRRSRSRSHLDGRPSSQVSLTKSAGSRESSSQRRYSNRSSRDRHHSSSRRSSQSRRRSRERSRRYSREPRQRSHEHDNTSEDNESGSRRNGDCQASNSDPKSPPQPPRPTKKSKWDVPVATDLGPGVGMSNFSYFGGGIFPPLEDRRGRRLYVGNLPPGISEAAIVQFFNGALLAAAGVDYAVAAASGQFPVLRAEAPTDRSAQYLPDHRYCFVEFRTIADATICLKLDGISFNGFMLKIGRPNDYTAVPKPQEMSTPEALASGSVVSELAKLVPETKMYATDLPLTMTDLELRRLCEPFGTVRTAALMKDLRTGQSMGCGIVEFEDSASTEAAVKALDGKPINGRTPKFTKGPLVPSAVTKIMEQAKVQPPQTSSVVTELPTSMTHKVFTNAIIGAQVQAARRDGSIPSLVVQLLNCVYPEDLIKDEDYKSILEDIRNEASAFGTVLNVVIPRPPPDLSFKPGVGKVFIHFADITAARKAQAELNGRRFEERRVICAAFYPVDRFLDQIYTIT